MQESRGMLCSQYSNLTDEAAQRVGQSFIHDIYLINGIVGEGKSSRASREEEGRASEAAG